MLVKGAIKPGDIAVLEPEEGKRPVSDKIDIRQDREDASETYQFSVSGLIVLSFPLCFAQVLQLAFSNRTPLAISFFFYCEPRVQKVCQ